MENNHRTDAMIRALNIVRECGGYTKRYGYEDDIEYMKIYSLMMAYLKERCNHEWEKDEVDTGPDSYHTLFYCKKCYLCS